MTTVRLPFPISTNRLLRAVSGRAILSEPYRRWKKEAAQEIMIQRARHVPGKVSVSVELVAPDKRRRDADNCLKSCLDALVTGRLIEDDSAWIVKRLSVEWRDSGHPCVVHILPWELAA